MCGLTHAKPAFQDHCEEFELDSDREKQLINREKIREDRLEAYSEDYDCIWKYYA